MLWWGSWVFQPESLHNWLFPAHQCRGSHDSDLCLSKNTNCCHRPWDHSLRPESLCSQWDRQLYSAVSECRWETSPSPMWPSLPPSNSGLPSSWTCYRGTWETFSGHISIQPLLSGQTPQTVPVVCSNSMSLPVSQVCVSLTQQLERFLRTRPRAQPLSNPLFIAQNCKGEGLSEGS